MIIDPERWVDEHGDYLYRYALTRLKNPDVAEDIVQETFMAALKARERFAGQSTERTWLTGILKHKIVDRLRVQYREISATDLEQDDDEAEGGDPFFDRFDHWKQGVSNWKTNPAELLEQSEFWGVLDSCVRNIPDKMRQAFSLRVLDNLSTEEVCKILNVTTTNLNVILHRARLRLRQCLETNWFA